MVAVSRSLQKHLAKLEAKPNSTLKTTRCMTIWNFRERERGGRDRERWRERKREIETSIEREKAKDWDDQLIIHLQRIRLNNSQSFENTFFLTYYPNIHRKNGSSHDFLSRIESRGLKVLS